MSFGSRQMIMIVLLLLLGAVVSAGPSRESYREEVFGTPVYINMLGTPDSIEFSPKHNSNVTVIWKQGDPSLTADKKYRVTLSFFVIYDLTQKDSGRYITRDKARKKIYTYTIEVKATTKTYKRRPGGSLSFSYRLKPDACNIYFFPERDPQPSVLQKEIVRQGSLRRGSDETDCVGLDLLQPCGLLNDALQMSCNGRYEIRDQNNNTAMVASLEMQRIRDTYERKPGEGFSFTFDLESKFCNIYFFPESDRQPMSAVNIVRNGRLQGGLAKYDCTGFDLIWPCGISNEDLQLSCRGRYEIRDQNNDTAMEVSLEMQPLPYEPSHIAIGFGAVLSSIFCYCVKCCCCGKSSSKEDRSEAAAAGEPDEQECDNEPVGPRPAQVSLASGTEIRYHPPENEPPAYSKIPYHPSVNVPPAYSEISFHPTVNVPPAYSEAAAPAEESEAPTVTVHSDPEPQFELSGMTFPSAPLLSSDSTHSDVFTSDKLNFL